MKQTIKSAIAVFLCCLMCGCSVLEENRAEHNEKTQLTFSEQPDIMSAEIPVLSIVTANGKNDFAEKPVSEFVSKQIASWTPGYVIPPAPYYEDCKISLKEGNNTLIDSAEASVKVRGNWTTNYSKKPFRIKFTENRSMLDLNGGEAFKNWVLLAEYKDASMLRNKSSLELSREILGKDGLYVSDSAFVDVEINGDYWGVYLLAEYQQVNEERVNITEPINNYSGTDIGYFLEYDGNFINEQPLYQFHVDYHNNAELKPFDGNGGSGRTIRCLPLLKNDPKKDIGFTIKSDIVSREQHDFIASYVNNVYNIMYEAAYYDKAFIFNEDYSDLIESDDLTPREAVERVVDVNSLVDMYIISELTCDADLYWSSFFMTADFGKNGNRKLTFQAPWDFDSALGNKSRCPDGKGFYASNIIPDVNGDTYETINPWLAVISYEDWYRELISQKWTEIYDSGAFDRVSEMIAADTIKYKDAFLRNNERWGISTEDYSVIGELSVNALKCKTQEAAAVYLDEWLQSRVDFLNDYWHK